MDPITLGLVGWGAGSVLGGLSDMFSAKSGLRAQKRATEKQMELWDQTYNQLSPYYQKVIDQLPLDQQISALQQWTPTQYQEFDHNATRSFLDPSIDFQIEQSNKSALAGQAASGNLGSGAALKELSDRAQKIGETGYTNAQNAALQNWRDSFNMQRQSNQDQYTNLQNLYNISSGAVDNLVGLKTNVANANAQAIGQLGNINAQNAQSNWIIPSQVGKGLATLGGQAMGYGMAQRYYPTPTSNMRTATTSPVFGVSSPYMIQNPYIQPEPYTTNDFHSFA